MTWRGIIRSISASNRRAATAHRRAVAANDRLERTRYRLAVHNLRDAERADARAQAAAEVEEYAARLATMKSLHASPPQWVDWRAILHSAPPPTPPIASAAMHAAQRDLAAHAPSLLSRVMGSAVSERQRLENLVHVAMQIDAAENARRAQVHALEIQQWEWTRRLADGVLQGDAEAYRVALDWARTFEELEELGAWVQIHDIRPGAIELDVHLVDDAVVPAEAKSLTAAGKVSAKKLSSAARNDMYQDFVCGSVLRVARDITATVPVQGVLVHAVGELINQSTGHLESEAVVTAWIPVETLKRLRFDRLDASDSFKNFLHRMDWTKSRGFAPVAPLTFDEAANPDAHSLSDGARRRR